MRSASVNRLSNSISSVRAILFRNVDTALALGDHRNITPNANGATRNRRDPSSCESCGRDNVRCESWIAAATTVFLCVLYHSAWANPVFDVIDGSNWDLPIVPSANAIIQRGLYQSSGMSYDARGKSISGPSTTEYLGLTSFAHLFSYESLPKVGFYWEVFLPEVDVEPPGHAQSVSGLGDPLFIMSAYARPIPNLLLGLQSLTSIPVGSNAVTSHRFEEYPHIIADYRLGKVGFDASCGVGIFATQHNGPGSVRSGNKYFVETAVRYRVNDMFEPFIINTYQTQDSGTTLLNKTHITGNHQDDLGGGAKITFTHKRWLSIWYYSSVDGRDVGKTNGVYFRFVNLF